MNKILTLCDKCQKELAEGFRVKRLTFATTELKRACENCGMKGSSYVLARYMVENKKKGR